MLDELGGRIVVVLAGAGEYLFWQRHHLRSDRAMMRIPSEEPPASQLVRLWLKRASLAVLIFLISSAASVKLKTEALCRADDRFSSASSSSASCMCGIRS